MYELSPRSKEIVNSLFQIDELTEDQVRAVLRHVTIDDAVFNEAQCSHIAGLIDGTLHHSPREGVNATLTCDTSWKAAASWEKSYASYPGHISATFHESAIGSEAGSNQSPPRMALPKAGQTAPAQITGESQDAKDSTANALDLKGLTIVNHGSLTLHYHSYTEPSHATPQPAVLPRKRTLAEAEDQQYSEALASLMEFNDPGGHSSPLEPPAKRLAIKEPEAGVEDEEIIAADPQVSEQSADRDEMKSEQQQEQNDEQAENQMEAQDVSADDHSMIKKKKRTRRCARCGQRYEKADNEGFNFPCCYHPGTVQKYPQGLKHSTNKMRELLFVAWDCCHKDPDSQGCRPGKHTRSLK